MSARGTSWREAFYLPLIFLTVTLLGGLRLGGPVGPNAGAPNAAAALGWNARALNVVTLVPPPLFALVLAVLLLGVLVGCGALGPEQLMNPSRPALANLNGLVVVITLVLASAQAFNLAMPESGLPRLLLSVFLLILLINTLAALPDRTRVLRSVMVMFGSAFVLKFIVLAAISEPADGWLKRVLLAMLDGVTLGTLTQPVLHPAAGYVAFFTFVLFLIGLALLPPPRRVAPRATRLPSPRAELPEGV